MKKKKRIQVFESPISFKVIAEFNTLHELIKYAEENNLNADQVAIDDQILLGWDEL